MKSRKLKISNTQYFLLGLIVLIIIIPLVFLSYKGTITSYNHLNNKDLSIRIAQGSARISFSNTKPLSAIYSSATIPAFRSTFFGLKYFSLQGGIHVAIPSSSKFPIKIVVGQGSIVADTGETYISSTSLKVGQGSVLIVPSNLVSSSHSISITQGALDIILPYGINGFRIDTGGRRIMSLDKIDSYIFTNGGYQSRDYETALIKATLVLSGNPILKSIKIITKEDTKKAYFGK